ncbi:unnamed protein product [Penicillium glandicola]
MTVAYFIFALLLASMGLYSLKRWVLSSKLLPLPPGPPGKPIIGNLLDFPKPGCKEWEHWLKHKDLYGPISSLVTMGQTVILLNKSEVAYELLDKRSASHSSRPQPVFSVELAGWGRMVTLNGDASVVRTHRKYITSLIGSKNAIVNLHSQLDLGARHFLLQNLEQPDSLIPNIRRFTGARILDMVYGYKVESSGRDPLVDLADLSAKQFSSAAQTGTWIVDSIPILKYLPAWFPGAGFQRIAREWGKVLNTLAEKPYAFVLHQRSNKRDMSSYVSRHLNALGDDISPDEEHVIKWTAAAIYGAGADTSVSALSTFFLVMAQFPDIRHRAQAELDLAIGSRLPTIEDRPNLPYVNALMQEVMRWHPVAPLGVPHMTTADDEYCGYRIPRGAVLIPNIWSFTHDPETYVEPMKFNPERFMQHEGGTSPEQDPRKLVFGFGRRICPGRFLADASLFLSIAKSLAVFDITRIPGASDKESHLSDGFLPGIISHPSPFRAQIRPRSEDARILIKSIETEDPWLKGDSEVFDQFKW